MKNKYNKNGSTTMSLQAIVEATATAQNGQRYSLNSIEICEKRAEMTLSLKLLLVLLVLSLQVTEIRRFTMDHKGVDLIDNASINGVVVSGTTQTPATAISAWDATVGSGQEWLWKKHEFLKKIEEGNINIITKTLRACASYIIAGNNVAALIKQLPGDKFKPVGNLNKMAPTGPVKIGTLDGRPVIHDPLLLDRSISGSTVTGANRYILGYKGSNFLTSGFVFCPYIPFVKERLHQVTGVENSVNCWNVRSMLKYDCLRKAA